MPDILMLGGGGHALSLRAMLTDLGLPVRGYLAPERSDRLDGTDWMGDDDRLQDLDPHEVVLVNALGSVGLPRARRAVGARARDAGFSLPALVHPRAFVDAGASVFDGAQVFAGAIVGVAAEVGADAIVNTGAIVEHECVIGESTHIAPGAVLAGGVHVGDACHIGLGARILQGVRVGSESVVGAGAVVIDDVPPGTTVVGVPARVLDPERRRTRG